MRVFLVVFILVAIIFSRLIPHIPNFVPLMGLALFAGYYLKNSKWALLAPLAAMLISDIIIGFHSTMWAVYGSLLLSSIISIKGLKSYNLIKIGALSISTALIFFIITNFAVWLDGFLYERSFAGLVQCYVMAIPFFKATFASELIGTLVLFAGFNWLQSRLPETSIVK